MSEPRADVFRDPAAVFADIDGANWHINTIINPEIQRLSRERSYWNDRKDNARSELKAMAGPDGHLPGCERTGHCLGEGWCRP
jgi:hypothetical protein